MEAPTDNAVAIAEIEANKEITIAAIDADARIQTEASYSEARVAEAYKEANAWDPQISSLTEQVSSLSSTVESLTAMVTSLVNPPVSLVEVTAEPLNSETLESLTPQSTLEGTNETPMEATPESVEDGQTGLLPPLVEIERGPIIRLV